MIQGLEGLEGRGCTYVYPSQVEGYREWVKQVFPKKDPRLKTEYKGSRYLLQA